MTRETLGDFEQLVLLACLRLGTKAYTVAILDEILRHTDRRATHAAVYVALRRLEKRGLVESRLGAPTAQRGGKAKRFFVVRTKAVAVLESSRNALLSMWEGVELPNAAENPVAE